MDDNFHGEFRRLHFLYRVNEGEKVRRRNTRALVIAMCEAHALSGKCGPDCICQELLDEIEPKRRKHWKRYGYRKAAKNGA